MEVSRRSQEPGEAPRSRDEEPGSTDRILPLLEDEEALKARRLSRGFTHHYLISSGGAPRLLKNYHKGLMHPGPHLDSLNRGTHTGELLFPLSTIAYQQ